MKNKQCILSLPKLMLFMLLAACSGNQKQIPEDKQATDKGMAKSTESAAIAVPAFEGVDASVKSQINGFLDDYFLLNKALIEDNQEGAKSSAKKLAQTIAGFDGSKISGEQLDFYQTQSAKLNAGLEGIEKSADIEETRIELITVSEVMYALVKAYHPNESELYYQFCPMANNGEGANWISNQKEIINPYMGQRMLKCGSTQETL